MKTLGIWKKLTFVCGIAITGVCTFNYLSLAADAEVKTSGRYQKVIRMKGTTLQPSGYTIAQIKERVLVPTTQALGQSRYDEALEAISNLSFLEETSEGGLDYTAYSNFNKPRVLTLKTQTIANSPESLDDLLLKIQIKRELDPNLCDPIRFHSTHSENFNGYCLSRAACEIAKKAILQLNFQPDFEAHAECEKAGSVFGYSVEQSEEANNLTLLLENNAPADLIESQQKVVACSVKGFRLSVGITYNPDKFNPACSLSEISKANAEILKQASVDHEKSAADDKGQNVYVAKRIPPHLLKGKNENPQPEAQPLKVKEENDSMYNLRKELTKEQQEPSVQEFTIEP